MSDELPFPHEYVGIGIFIIFIYITIVLLDPAGTNWTYALFSVLVSLAGGFIMTVILYALVDLYYNLTLGFRVDEVEPTLGVLTIVLIGGGILTLFLLFTDVPIQIVESLQPGEVGDHPLRKGSKAVVIMTAALSTLVSELVLFPLIDKSGIDVVNETQSEED